MSNRSLPQSRGHSLGWFRVQCRRAPEQTAGISLGRVGDSISGQARQCHFSPLQHQEHVVEGQVVGARGHEWLRRDAPLRLAQDARAESVIQL